MPRKENTKAKTWERDRRSRMNQYFKTLADLLPPHQEGRKRNKVDTLVHASKYIKDLHSRTEELFFAHASDAHKEELARLKKLVTQLFSRTQLLSSLLKEAGISVPAEPALEKMSPLKWSNKLNLEDNEKFFGRIDEKKRARKRKGKTGGNKVPSKRKSVTLSQTSSKKVSSGCAATQNGNGTIKNQENPVNNFNNENDLPNVPTNIAVSVAASEATVCRNVSPGKPHATSTSDIVASDASHPNASTVVRNAGTHKKVKKKCWKSEKSKTSQCVTQPATSLASGTLIISDGKIMPVVTPLTSNIMVNPRSQTPKPLLLSNAQPNQMIVMQPLPNSVTSSVMSVRNKSLVNSVQKVTLNTVPGIQTNMVINSQNWLSNVKNMIDSTKIGGHKGILPKGHEVTKTTMSYKVPIAAVRKEKAEKNKESNNRKETDVRTKIKSPAKSTKHQQSSSPVKTAEEGTKVDDKRDTPEKISLKRSFSFDCTNAEQPDDKKRKTDDDSINCKNVQSSDTKLVDIPITCKSIESLKHVIEKIGEDMAEKPSDRYAEASKEVGKTDRDKSNEVHCNIADSEQKPSSSPLSFVECQVGLNSEQNEEKTSKEANSSSSSTENGKQNLESTESRISDEGVVQSTDVGMAASFSTEDATSISPEESAEMLESSSAETVTTDKGEKAVAIEGTDVISERADEEVCTLENKLDNLLQENVRRSETVDAIATLDSAKIILNLDTNTTTTMKPETNSTVKTSSPSVAEDSISESKLGGSFTKDEGLKSLSYSADNSFIPINRTEALHSDLSNDIFASLQVPSSSQNPESISPTAAFLMAFPLVSSLNGKTEVLEEEMKEDFKYHSQTPPMLLQIGAIEPNSFKIKTTGSVDKEHSQSVATVEIEKKITSPRVSSAEKFLKDDDSKAVEEPSKISNGQIEVKVGQNNSSRSELVKTFPKIVDSETIKEPYKIVETSVEPVVTKTTMEATPSFAYGATSTMTMSTAQNRSTSMVWSTSMNRNANTTTNGQLVTSASSAVFSTIKYDNPVHRSTMISTVGDNYQSQGESQSIISSSVPCNDPVLRSSIPSTAVGISSSASSKYNEPRASIPLPIGKYNVGTQYTGVQNFVPNYSNVCGNMELPQYTTPSFTSTIRMTSQDASVRSNEPMHVSQASIGFPIIPKNSLVTSHALHRTYTGHGKDPLATSSQNHQQRYSALSKESVSTQSQNLQHNYPGQMKDSALQLPSQNIPLNYPTPKKDSLPNMSQNMQHNYPPHGKDLLPASSQDSHQSYVVRNKEDVSQNLHYGYATRNKDSLSTSTQNLHHVYSAQGKDSLASSTHTIRHNYPPNPRNENSDQNAKMSEVMKPQNQEHRHENYSTKKVETDNFAQSFSYDKGTAVANNQSEQPSTANPDIAMFQSKRPVAQSYMPYSKDIKKVIPGSVAQVDKSSLQNAVHYSQHQMIATSNYEHSTVTENNMKSTTTVAHNSSNFSILSWTTFSPASGNNNLVHFEHGQAHTDTTAESKTICENFSYIPLHKENLAFSNMIPEPFPNDSNVAVNKARVKHGVGLEVQKNQPFVDPSKAQNVQSSISTQKQSQDQSGEYKFDNENKSKDKYAMDTNYIQNDYTRMDQTQAHQQQQQQHGSKHQGLPPKHEKSSYPMTTYNSQVTFNLPETSGQPKYSAENYTGTNFKYTDKSQQSQKYQPLTQSQAPPILQHNATAYNKHTQNTNNNNSNNSNNNKSKSQQQSAMRPPVNWMMTPDIKHNTNIADIILPPIGKEHDFCQNNLFSQTSTYNQGTPNQFYNNYDVTHGFPNMPVLQNDLKKIDSTFYSEEQPFSWSPTKNTHNIEQSQSIKSIDQHIVPSTLPTLVGDLALGTNIPEKQNFLFGQMPARTINDPNKNLIKEKEANNAPGRDFQTLLNSQNVQHTAQGTFLSVSQLVEHEKAEKSQQQQQQQHQVRKHQRKSNASPRGGSGKRQMEMRKQTTASDQLHHEETKSAEQNFSDQQQQQQQQQNYQQKYHQNDVHWRNRNCKSNYTAEALIGTNSSVQEDNQQQQDKHGPIKFTPNYSQNKFPSGLPSDSVMPINYFPNADDGNNYGQVNQNFNTYAYSSNANIYPTTNFITSITNTPAASYMMPLHENTDYLEANSFLLPNVTAGTSPAKNQHYSAKHQNCDKRSYSTPKKSKRRADNMMQNLEFSISGISSPLEDYHSTFLPHANLYQNSPQANIYPKAVNGNLPGLPMGGNQNVSATGLPMNSNIVRGMASNSPMVMTHPSGTSLTNFNLSTIFPEINDKVTGYKAPNSIQPSSHGPSYAQRANYSNTLGHPVQVSESAQFTDIPPPPVSVVHYKNA